MPGVSEKASLLPSPFGSIDLDRAMKWQTKPSISILPTCEEELKTSPMLRLFENTRNLQ